MTSADAVQGPADAGTVDLADAVQTAAKLWWVSALVGVLWMVAALAILQFDQASISTVGYITGAMFVLAGLQQLVIALVVGTMRWVFAIFGVLFVVAGGICFVNPEETFAGLADILGFLFLIVGLWWTMRAFLERAASSTWWVGLVAGLTMIVIAFWTGGQFAITKAYTLLVFAGMWALLHGVTDVVRAFQLRKLRGEIEAQGA